MENTGVYGAKFHTDCFNEWRENLERFYQELDMPMNACVYFTRTGSSMYGYYIRDGKRHQCLAEWNAGDVSGSSIFPTMVSELKLDFSFVKIQISDPLALLVSFRQFLAKNGWSESWFEWRKPVVYKFDALNKHHATS